jgi:hypothetical protein
MDRIAKRPRMYGFSPSRATGAEAPANFQIRKARGIRALPGPEAHSREKAPHGRGIRHSLPAMAERSGHRACGGAAKAAGRHARAHDTAAIKLTFHISKSCQFGG